jgi:hypothetical protein
MDTYKLTADTVGNPDHGQDPTRPLWGAPPLRVSDIKLEDIVTTFRDWIGEHDLGGGNITNCRLSRKKVGGKVYTHFLDVSYNGRLWAKRPRESLEPQSEYIVEEGKLVEYKPVTSETRAKVISKLREQGAQDLKPDTIRKALKGTVGAAGLIRAALTLIRNYNLNKWDLADG